jgi:hypothetical protein
MTLEKEPFRNYKLDEEKEPKNFEFVGIKFNLEEYAKLQELKKIIKQPKQSKQ